jgi:phage terminase Nu1 subunit (DNA packaging protein)
MANRGKAEVELTKLNQQQIAFICGVTARSVRDWAEAPRNSDGTYNAQDFVAWFVTRTTGGSETEKEFHTQRERLAAAQAEKVEVENRVRQGELVEVKETISVWSDIVSGIRAKLLTMPSKMGPQLVNIADPSIIVGKLRTEIYDTLEELADSESNDVADTQTPADVDNIAVVGQVSEVK